MINNCTIRNLVLEHGFKTTELILRKNNIDEEKAYQIFQLSKRDAINYIDGLLENENFKKILKLREVSNLISEGVKYYSIKEIKTDIQDIKEFIFTETGILIIPKYYEDMKKEIEFLIETFQTSSVELLIAMIVSGNTDVSLEVYSQDLTDVLKVFLLTLEALGTTLTKVTNINIYSEENIDTNIDVYAIDENQKILELRVEDDKTKEEKFIKAIYSTYKKFMETDLINYDFNKKKFLLGTEEVNL